MSYRPKFSIIVPMYNVQPFLSKCVDSILGQTLSDIEIILVDDGSPDKCGEIADSYARKDARIRVVHRCNGGLGPARNSGMEVATGEYIGFVDSDDWIEPEMYEELYAAAKSADADIVFTGLKTVRHGVIDEIRTNPLAGHTLNGPDEIFLLRQGFYGPPPAKVKDEAIPVSVDVGGYRREFVENNKLRFRAVRSEDIIFNTMSCRVASRIVCISGAPYCYRRDNQPSITNTFSKDDIDSFFLFFHQMRELVDEEPSKYWKECNIRTQRCVIDYSRVLIGMIDGSAESYRTKKAYTREVMDGTALRQACSDYPWWSLPIQQLLFFLVLKAGWVSAALWLVNLKRRK